MVLDFKDQRHMLSIVSEGSRTIQQLVGSTLALPYSIGKNLLGEIPHDKLTLALRRLGFNRHYADVIADWYSRPIFSQTIILDLLT